MTFFAKISYIIYNTPYLLIPFTPYAGGNQINLHFNIDDNGSAGYRIQRVIRWNDNVYFGPSGLFKDLSRYEQIPSIYVDDDGRITDMEFAFSDYDPKEDSRLNTYQDYLDQGDATPVAIPFETVDGVKDLEQFFQVQGSLRLMKDNREKIALSLIYHFVSNDPDIIVGYSLPRRNKLISLANNDDLRVFYFDRKLNTRSKEKIPTDGISDAQADLTIDFTNYYVDVNNEVPQDAVSYVIASEDLSTFLIVNDVNKNRIVFDFERNRTGVTYKYIDAEDDVVVVSPYDVANVNYDTQINFDEEEIVADDSLSTTESLSKLYTFKFWFDELINMTYEQSVETSEQSVNVDSNITTIEGEENLKTFKFSLEELSYLTYNKEVLDNGISVDSEGNIQTNSGINTPITLTPSITEMSSLSYTITVPDDSDTINVNQSITTSEVLQEDLPTVYELTYQASGAGTISGESEGFYEEGTGIFLTTSAFSGWSFSHWESNDPSLDGSTNSNLGFTISQDTDLTAVFTVE